MKLREKYHPFSLCLSPKDQAILLLVRANKHIFGPAIWKIEVVWQNQLIQFQKRGRNALFFYLFAFSFFIRYFLFPPHNKQMNVRSSLTDVFLFYSGGIFMMHQSLLCPFILAATFRTNQHTRDLQIGSTWASSG